MDTCQYPGCTLVTSTGRSTPVEQITRTALVEDLGEQIEALQDARDEAVRVLRAAISRPDPPRSWLADHIARALDELGDQP